jgi:hypothetical protein
MTNNFTPFIPVAAYYENPRNPGTFDVYFSVDDTDRTLTPHTYFGAKDLDLSGTPLVQLDVGQRPIRDPEGDTARIIIAAGAARETTISAGRSTPPSEIGLGLGSPLDAIVARKFGLLKLVNGKTGKSKVIDIARSAKRVPR